MSVENKSLKIKKKKKQTKKLLPKNVFEVVGENGKIIERVDSNKKKEDKPKKKPTEEKQVFSERTQKRRRREWDLMNYEPFDITRARDYERSLQRVATRGIVQLFNTVRKQQQQHGPSTKKKDTGINKGEFLDMLRNIDSDEIACKVVKKEQPKTEAKPVRWNVLQDDLMASVKDGIDDDDDDD